MEVLAGLLMLFFAFMLVACLICTIVFTFEFPNAVAAVAFCLVGCMSLGLLIACGTLLGGGFMTEGG